MIDFNKVTVHGRIVRNADFNITSSGLVVAKFAVAVNRARKLPDGTWASEDDTSFFPLAVFGDYACAVGKRLQKGRGVLVEGHLRQHKWEKDGEKRSDTVICVEKLYFDPPPRKENAEYSDDSGTGPFTPEEEICAEQVFNMPVSCDLEEYDIF